MRTSLRLTSASFWTPCMVISSISFEGGVLLTHTMCALQELRAHKLSCCRDELNAAWKIFTPVLHAIDRGELVPSQYQAGTAHFNAVNDAAWFWRDMLVRGLPPHAGTRGPAEADVLVGKCGYIRNDNYLWKKPVDRKSGA